MKEINWDSFARNASFPNDFPVLFQDQRHPATRLSFDCLYEGLKNNKDFINMSSYKDLELFNYNCNCTFEKHWNYFTLISRGLILNPSQKTVVSLPLIKFGNWGEFGMWTPNCGFSVFDKYDGSLAIIFYWNGDWRVATRGSFSSDQAVWAKYWLDQNVCKNKLFPGDTYLAEIIYAENRIVVHYDFEGLILLTAYDNQGYEIGFGEAQSLGKEAEFLPCRQFHYTRIEELLEVAEKMTADAEGFVVRFENGYRVKIKGAEYVRVHRLIAGVTPLRVWESMMNGDDLEAIKAQLPEELQKDFDAIRNIIDQKTQSVVNELTEAHERTKDLSDKDLGLTIKNGSLGESEAIRSMLFCVRKHDLLEDFKEKRAGRGRRMVFATCKPKGNKLAGYKPSSAMNRFAEDE